MKWRYLGCILLAVLMMSGCIGDSNSESAVKDKPAGESEPVAQSGPVECDWQMTIDDSVDSVLYGVAFTHTLIINAEKRGGTDDLGTYQGTMHLKIDHHLPADAAGSNSVEGQVDNFTVELVPYDDSQYMDYGRPEGEAPLAQLVQYTGMGLQEQSFEGAWQADIVAVDDSGARVTKNEGLPGSVKIKMAVEGGQVNVTLIFPAQTVTGFKGMITGTPISGQ